MEEASTIGLDIEKTAFHAYRADAAGHLLCSRRITRAKLLAFFAAQPRCVVAMETRDGGTKLAADNPCKAGGSLRLNVSRN